MAEELKSAYRQLARCMHPDKHLGIPEAVEAFKLLSGAEEYMAFGLQSEIAQALQMNIIRNNAYYKKYGNRGFPKRSSLIYTAYDRANSPSNPSAKAQKMSFAELIEKAQRYDLKPISPAVVEELKRRILADSSLLSEPISCSYPNQRIIHIAVRHGNLDFVNWLIKQGADPFIIDDRCYFDIATIALITRKLDILTYLFQRYGNTFFYEQGGNALEHSPKWGLLECAISANSPTIAEFLLIQVGFINHLNGQTFDTQWVGRARAENSLKLTSLLLQHQLINDPESALYNAIGRKEIDVAKLLLERLPNFDISQLFNEYLQTLNDSEEGLHFLRNLAAGQHLSAYTLAEFVRALSHLLWRSHENYKADPWQPRRQVPAPHKRPERRIGLFLLPELFARLHACEVPSLEELAAPIIQALSQEEKEAIFNRARQSARYSEMHEADLRQALYQYAVNLIKQAKQLNDKSKESCLLSAFCNVAIADAPEVFLELLAITRTPLQSEKARQDFLSPLLIVLMAIAEGSQYPYKVILPLLIQEGGPSLLSQTRADGSSFNYLPNPNIKHLDYAPLHLCCELGLAEHALQIATKMAEETLDLDLICHRREKIKIVKNNFTGDYYSTSIDHYYTALHLALEKKQEEVALKLLEAGADYTIKAKIERPRTSRSSFFFQSKNQSERERLEQTTLQMAIANQQYRVIRALQIKLLDVYITKRQGEEDYLSHFTLFGYTLFRFGFFHKNSKLSAARDLREAFLRGEIDHRDLHKQHRGASSQGRLGVIARLSTHIPESHCLQRQATII